MVTLPSCIKSSVTPARREAPAMFPTSIYHSLLTCCRKEFTGPMLLTPDEGREGQQLTLSHTDLMLLQKVLAMEHQGGQRYHCRHKVTRVTFFYLTHPSLHLHLSKSVLWNNSSRRYSVLKRKVR